jgi:hypothetical protein
MPCRLFGLVALASAPRKRFRNPRITDDLADNLRPAVYPGGPKSRDTRPGTDGTIKPAVEGDTFRAGYEAVNLDQASNSLRTFPPSTISIGRSPGAINSLSATMPKRS